jgi:hypothetical protein
MENSMMEWVENDADKAIPFLLAEAGYDVWLGNNRGCEYGLQHVTLSPN